MSAANLSDHAAEQLRYIRNTMQRAVSFTAVPGIGMILIGIGALMIALLAQFTVNPAQRLIPWAVAAPIALALGLFATWRKSLRTAEPLIAGAGRKFLLALLPAGILCTALAFALWIHGLPQLIPTVWLGGYGTGVIAAGAHSVTTVPLMGAVFLALGLAALIVSVDFHNSLLALGFGITHLVFGIWIARHHGG